MLAAEGVGCAQVSRHLTWCLLFTAQTCVNSHYSLLMSSSRKFFNTL
jgi:hypothetical protein